MIRGSLTERTHAPDCAPRRGKRQRQAVCSRTGVPRACGSAGTRSPRRRARAGASAADAVPGVSGRVFNSLRRDRSRWSCGRAAMAPASAGPLPCCGGLPRTSAVVPRRNRRANRSNPHSTASEWLNRKWFDSDGLRLGARPPSQKTTSKTDTTITGAKSRKGCWITCTLTTSDRCISLNSPRHGT